MPTKAPHSNRPVQPGDVIVFSGRPHLIVSTDHRTKAGNPVARAADGWGITLDEDGTLNIPQPNERCLRDRPGRDEIEPADFDDRRIAAKFGEQAGGFFAFENYDTFDLGPEPF